MQERLTQITRTKPTYHTESYNKMDDKEQWIRISEGCPNQCRYCYAPKELIRHPIPEIKRNIVKILDMNFLYNPDHREIIEFLGRQKFNKKSIYYELICGIDWRRLTYPTAKSLKENRFVNIRFAWDYGFEHQYQIRSCFNTLIRAGYRAELLSCFMLCNWSIPYEECCKKLDLLKVWNVKVNDCWFDNQTSPNIKPLCWTDEEIKSFRKKCRKHNQLVRFKIDPEYKI